MIKTYEGFLSNIFKKKEVKKPDVSVKDQTDFYIYFVKKIEDKIDYDLDYSMYHDSLKPLKIITYGHIPSDELEKILNQELIEAKTFEEISNIRIKVKSFDEYIKRALDRKEKLKSQQLAAEIYLRASYKHGLLWNNANRRDKKENLKQLKSMIVRKRKKMDYIPTGHIVLYVMGISLSINTQPKKK